MRRSLRENLIAVARFWWALVAGLGLGIYGLSQIVGDTTHHRSAWFWLFLGMAAICLAQFLAYHSLRQERDRLIAQDRQEGAADVEAADLLRQLQDYNRRAHDLRSQIERGKLRLTGAGELFYTRKLPKRPVNSADRFAPPLAAKHQSLKRSYQRSTANESCSMRTRAFQRKQTSSRCSPRTSTRWKK
jgi:hypothetical protein